MKRNKPILKVVKRYKGNLYSWNPNIFTPSWNTDLRLQYFPGKWTTPKIPNSLLFAIQPYSPLGDLEILCENNSIEGVVDIQLWKAVGDIADRQLRYVPTANIETCLEFWKDPEKLSNSPLAQLDVTLIFPNTVCCHRIKLLEQIPFPPA